MRSFIAEPVAEVGGTVSVPGDKSISHRAIMLAGICDGTSEIAGFLPSEDCRATLRAIRCMGAAVEELDATHIRIQGRGLKGLSKPRAPLDMGNAGTAMRLFAGLLAGQHFDSELVGDASLSKRPMERVALPLRAMGAQVVTQPGGTAPLRIQGGRRLHGIEYRMPMASAQVKSALLLAGLYASGPTTVIEPGVTRDHSERMLKSMGVDVRSAASRITLTPALRLTAQHIVVPGDFSSAAFMIVAGLIGGARDGVHIRGVGLNPTRTGFLDIVRRMGASISISSVRHAGDEPVADLFVERSELQGIDVPPQLVPASIDEIPALVLAAACARGRTRITGAEELRVKESDRIEAMAAGLRALGVEHEVYADGLAIDGDIDRRFSGAEIDSLGDHRVAMSFAIASVRSAAPIRIRDTANVATSFPGFVDAARLIGLKVSEC